MCMHTHAPRHPHTPTHKQYTCLKETTRTAQTLPVLRKQHAACRLHVHLCTREHSRAPPPPPTNPLCHAQGTTAPRSQLQNSSSSLRLPWLWPAQKGQRATSGVALGHMGWAGFQLGGAGVDRAPWLNPPPKNGSINGAPKSYRVPRPGHEIRQK